MLANVSSLAGDTGYAGTGLQARRFRAMTHASDVAVHTIAHEDAVVARAWLGPAIGSVILTIAWAAYLVPLLIGIFSIGL